MTKLLTGIGIICLLIIVFPEGKSAYDSFITDMLAITGITSGLAYIMLTTLPYWVIGAVLFRVAMMIFGSKSNRMGGRRW